MRDYKKAHKCLEALLNGYEMSIDDKLYIISEDLRLGYICGEIFYELSFAEFVNGLEKISDKQFMEVIAFLSLNK